MIILPFFLLVPSFQIVKKAKGSKTFPSLRYFNKNVCTSLVIYVALKNLLSGDVLIAQGYLMVNQKLQHSYLADRYLLIQVIL